jgi:hypothetical protein
MRLHDTAISVPELEQEVTAPPNAATPMRKVTPAQRLGLSWLDEQNATAFTSNSAKQLLEEIRARAEALAGPGGSPARRRTLAKALAICNSQISILQTIQGSALLAQKFKAAEQLDRMLERLTRRFAVLLEAHRHEYTDRPVVQVVGQ